MRIPALAAPTAAILIGIALSVMLFQHCGASVDLFVTITVLIAIASPLVVGWSRAGGFALLTAAGFCAGVTASWLWLARTGSISWAESLGAVGVGLSIGLALSGTARLLSGGAGRRFWPGFVGLAGFAWATWPVWLSVPLAGQRLVWSVAVQPLFAVNSAVLDLGNWVDQPTAYDLTSFGQDVSYKMPGSVWPAVLFHGLIAVITWTAVLWRERRGRRRATQTSPPPA